MNSNKSAQHERKALSLKLKVGHMAMAIASVLMVGSIASAKDESKTSSSTTSYPLINPIPPEYSSPAPVPASATWTTSNGTTTPTSVAVGQTVAMKFSVRSPIAASNVNVHVYVIPGATPESSIEIRNLTFAAGETKNLTAYYTAKASDKIGTIYWSYRVTHNHKVVGSQWASKVQTGTAITMKFSQTTGLPATAVTSRYTNDCEKGFQYVYVPCASGSILVNSMATQIGQYFVDTYRVMPAGCVESGSSISCNGSSSEVLKRWNGASAVSSDVAGNVNIAGAAAIDPRMGDERTLSIINDSNVAMDSAADFCADLNFSGYTDWVLPSKTELALLYCRSVAVKSSVYPQEMPGCSSLANYGYGSGNAASGLPFNTQAGNGKTIYVSSTEVDANRVWAMDFATGRQLPIAKTALAAVRCIRKQHGYKF